MTEGREVPMSVVVVDDSPEVRDLVGLTLHLSGKFTVVAEGATGPEAIKFAEEYQPDLVLLDLSLPEMGGLEALPSIVERCPQTKVVVLSGFEARGVAHQALRMGASAYIEKDIHLSRLAERLVDIFAGGDEFRQVLVGAGRPEGDVPALEGRLEAADATLGEHLERFRMAFDQAAIGMATLSLSHSFVRANEALCTMLGRRESELVGLPFEDFSHPEDRSATSERLDQLVNGTSVVEQFEQRLDRAGDVVWALTGASAVTDAASRPLYLFVQAQDITEHRRALDQVSTNEQLLQLLVSCLENDAVCQLDLEGHVSSWSEAAVRLTGYLEAQVLGHPIDQVYDGVAVPTDFDEALPPGQRFEGWCRHADGSGFPVRMTVQALRGRDGKPHGLALLSQRMRP